MKTSETGMKTRVISAGLLTVLLIGAVCMPLSFGLIQGELWSTALSGTKVIALSTIPDANGDGHEDAFVAINGSASGTLYLLNGLNGSIIQSQALGYVPLEVYCITSPALRIAVSYVSGVRVYNQSFAQIANFPTPMTPSHLQTFSGNDIVFYFNTTGQFTNWTITDYSITSGSLIWNHSTTGGTNTTRIFRDMLVLNSNLIVELGTGDTSTNHWWVTNSYNSTGGNQVTIQGIGGASSNDTLAMQYYNSTHFLYTYQTNTFKIVRLCLLNETGEFNAWGASILNNAGNCGFPIIDVNGDGVSDVLAIMNGGNPGVLNGRNGSTIYNVVALSASNISSVATVSDSDGNGRDEVAIYAGKAYLLSFGQTSVTIMWQQDFGSEGLAAIQDINGDGYKDIVAATGNTVNSFVGSAVPVIPEFPVNVTVSLLTGFATLAIVLAEKKIRKMPRSP
jgi:hypothetical protein